MDPHGSQIDNATLRKKGSQTRPTMCLRNELLLGRRQFEEQLEADNINKAVFL